MFPCSDTLKSRHKRAASTHNGVMHQSTSSFSPLLKRLGESPMRQSLSKSDEQVARSWILCKGAEQSAEESLNQYRFSLSKHAQFAPNGAAPSASAGVFSWFSKCSGNSLGDRVREKCAGILMRGNHSWFPWLKENLRFPHCGSREWPLLWHRRVARSRELDLCLSI